MGVCFSKSGKALPSNKVPSKVPPKENGMVKEEEKQPKLAEKIPALAVNKDSFKGQDNDWKETHVKNTAQHEDGSSKASGAIAGPLRVSSCTKEEVDAILIQCGRLSRNSSGKASNELSGASGRKRHSGSKGSRDFDNEKKEEVYELDKSESRPSPSRRASSRERSRSSGGRRVSRSPGRRIDGHASSATTSDKLKQQQPVKMVSVPATEKCSLFGNDQAEGACLGTEGLSATHQLSRSSSPANNTGISNENVQSQSLSWRDPMAEIKENSLRNQKEISSTSIFNWSREVDKVVRKPTQTQIIQQTKKPEIVEEAIDEVKNLSQRTLNRIRSRSSRKSSHDLDNYPDLNPISNTTLMYEEIQNKKKQQQQHQDAFLFPICVSETCSILQTVTELNSSFSEQRCYVTKVVTEPSLTPRESTGSNSSIRQPWASPSDLNSVDSSDHSKEVDVEDEVITRGTQRHKRSWPEKRSGASSSGDSLTEAIIKAAKTSGKKKFDHSPLQQVR